MANLDDRLNELICVLGLKKKGEYYITGWGKKTERGLKQTIKNILQLGYKLKGGD